MNDKEIRKEFSERLEVKLAQSDMSQAELARITGLSKDAISTYIRERSLPGPQNLKKLAEALKCQPADLVPKNLTGRGRSPATLTMIDTQTAHLKLEAEMPLEQATRILAILNETHHTEGGGTDT